MALPEPSYQKEELFVAKMFSKWEARTKWEINEGIGAAFFDKWISLNIKQELLWKMDAEGFLSMSFIQELHVEVVELCLA